MLRWLMPAALIAAPAAALAQTTPPTTAARLQRVEDQLAIEHMLVDYAAFLDARDYNDYADLFAPDGEWTNEAGTHKGRAAIRDMLATTMGPAGTPNRANYHIITNPRIDLAGDRATATSRFLFVMRDQDGHPSPSLAGVYHDKFVRQGGKWLIRRRVADNIMPTPEEWRKILSTQQNAK